MVQYISKVRLVAAAVVFATGAAMPPSASARAPMLDPGGCDEFHSCLAYDMDQEYCDGYDLGPDYHACGGNYGEILCWWDPDTGDWNFNPGCYIVSSEVPCGDYMAC